MITLLVNALGLGLMAFVIGWFWVKPKRPFIKNSSSTKNTKNGYSAEPNLPLIIRVKHGTYQPAFIKAKLGQPLTLRFIREDASACANLIYIEAFGITQPLPLNTPVDILLTPFEAGEYAFTCQMGMYKGILRVI